MRADAGIAANRRLVTALAVVTIAVLLRLAYSGRIELLPEEAYYWNYSRHLDIGYLDHPPMVAWLIRLGTALFGQTETGVRAGALLCGGIASGFVYALTRNLFGPARALAALVLMQALPFFFLAGMLMTPDAPLTAAWAAALYFLERAILAGRTAAWWGAGTALGLGLLSKYTIALIVPATLLFLLLDDDARRWLRRPEPYAACLLALALFSPVIVWNALHQWASFAFQTSRRLAEKPRFSLHKLLASMIVLLTPTGILALAPFCSPRRYALADRSKDAAPPAHEAAQAARTMRLLALWTGIPLAVFALFSLFHEVKLDWTGAPWVAAVPAIAGGFAGAPAGGAARAVWQRAWSITLVLLLGLYAAGFHHLAAGVHGLGYGTHPELVPVGWRALGADVEQLAAQVPGSTPPLVVGMDRYALASELAFYAQDPERGVRRATSAHLFGAAGLMYERWFPPSDQRGRTLLLIAWHPGELETPEVRARVEQLEPIGQRMLRRSNGDAIRPFYYRIARGYRGPD